MSKAAANDSVSVSVVTECLECQVCWEVPSGPPIYQCENGHILCKSCYPKLGTCPSCNIGLRSMRCLVAEKILEKVAVPCKFAKNGCSER